MTFLGRFICPLLHHNIDIYIFFFICLMILDLKNPAEFGNFSSVGENSDDNYRVRIYK